MNLLLLRFYQIKDNGIVEVTGRQAKHLIEILKVVVGSVVKVGVINYWIGLAKIIEINVEKRAAPIVQLQLIHANDTDEEKRSAKLLKVSENGFGDVPKCPFDKQFSSIRRPMIDLLMALPRPKTFDKVLQTAATMGVSRIFFTATSRVEIAYFSSPKLTAKSIEESLTLGLEQSAVDPFMPQIVIYASWDRCIKDLQSNFIIDKHTSSDSYYHSLVAFHPDSVDAVALDMTGISQHQGPILLAFGPEAGFLDFELNELQSIGFNICHMGDRVMRVETAVVAALAQVQMLMSQNPDKNTIVRKDLDSMSVSCWCQMTEDRPEQIVLPIKGPRNTTQ